MTRVNAERSPERAPDAPRAPGAPPLVVVIDDDDAVRMLVRRVLSDYDVVEFDRPGPALRALAGGLRPQVIISDIQMPGMSGFELHAAVRRIAPLRSVPFVYLTAMTDRDSLRRGMVQGADDYLTKPFTPSELREAVAVRLARQATLAEDDEAGVLHVTTLGGLSLALGEERLTWEARKVVELLAYLLDAGGEASAAHVRQDLWSGGAADNHLHVLVSRLRKTLAGAGRVQVADDTVRLALDVEVRWDVPAFEAAARLALATSGPADIEAALNAYGGEFLAGFDGAWADTRRSALDERFAQLLEAAVEAAPDEVARDRAQARLDAYYDLD
jgi:two-component SAPR family response regulator